MTLIIIYCQCRVLRCGRNVNVRNCTEHVAFEQGNFTEKYWEGERERERLPFDGFHPVGGGLPRRGPPLGECNNIQPFIEFINFFLNNAVVAHGKKGI